MKEASNRFFAKGIRSSFIIAFVISIYLSIFILWHYKNTNILNVDNSAQYLTILKVFNWLKTGNFRTLFIGYYPPLFHITSALLYYLLGVSEISTSFIILLWFFVLIFLTYLITKKIKDEASGLWAVVALGCFPYMTFMSRQIFIEVPVGVFSALFILAIISSNSSKSLSNEKPNLWYGIIFGLAMLTKWSSGIYLFVPIAWLFISSLKNGKKGVVNFAISFTPALLLATPWYILNFRGGAVAAVDWAFKIGQMQEVLKTNLIERLIWYLKVLTENMLGLPLSLLAIIGLFSLWSRASLLILSFLFVTLFFALMPILKNPRFLVPMLFIAAIFCGVGIRLVVSKLPKKLSIIFGGLILAYCTALFIHSSFGISFLSSNKTFLNSLFPMNDDPGLWEGSNPRPEKKEWKLLDLYETLISYMPFKSQVKVLIVSPLGRNSYSLVNYFLIFQIKDEIANKPWRLEIYPPNTTVEDITDFDFLIFEEIDYEKLNCNIQDEVIWASIEKGRQILRGNLLKKQFKLLRREYQPTGYAISLWENNKLETTKRIFRDRSFFFPATEPAVDNVVRANIDGFAEFIGASFEQSDNILKATYLWRCLKPIDKRYRIFVHFEIDGRFPEEMGGQDHWPLAGYYHTTDWKAGELIREYYEIPIPKNIKSGTYEVFIGMFDPKTGRQVPCSPRDVIKEEWRIKAGKIKIINKDADEKEN